jgi:RecG-like helicase
VLNRGGRIISGERLLTGRQLSEIKISSLPRIGDKRARLFHKLGIYNYFDLLYYLPKRYEDRRFREKLDDVKSGEIVSGKLIVYLKAEICQPLYDKDKVVQSASLSIVSSKKLTGRNPSLQDIIAEFLCFIHPS